MAVTVFSQALTDSGASDASSSERTPVALSGGGSAQWVRVTFRGAGSASFRTDHCAIGIQSSGVNTSATPVELKFSGVSGFNVAGGSVTSDWAILATNNSTVVVVMDFNGGSGGTRTFTTAVTGTQNKAASATYNLSSVTGFSGDTGGVNYITKIEVAYGYSLAATAGAYTLTGLAAFLGKQFILFATAGSYALTGTATGFRRGIRLLAATGSYTVTGAPAQLRRGLHLLAAVGSYAMTGSAAATRRGLRLLAAPGSYMLTGKNLIAAHLPGPVDLIRKTKFTLQNLRRNPPQSFQRSFFDVSPLDLNGGVYIVTISNLTASLPPPATPVLLLRNDAGTVYATFSDNGSASVDMPPGRYRFFAQTGLASFSASVVTDPTAPQTYAAPPRLGQSRLGQ